MILLKMKIWCILNNKQILCFPLFWTISLTLILMISVCRPWIIRCKWSGIKSGIIIQVFQCCEQRIVWITQNLKYWSYTTLCSIVGLFVRGMWVVINSIWSLSRLFKENIQFYLSQICILQHHILNKYDLWSVFKSFYIIPINTIVYPISYFQTFFYYYKQTFSSHQYGQQLWTFDEIKGEMLLLYTLYAHTHIVKVHIKIYSTVFQMSCISFHSTFSSYFSNISK